MQNPCASAQACARANQSESGLGRKTLLEHFLHRLARTEANDLPGGDHDDLVRLMRIAPNPLAALAHIEDPELAELDGLPFAQGIHDRRPASSGSRRRLAAGSTRFLRRFESPNCVWSSFASLSLPSRRAVHRARQQVEHKSTRLLASRKTRGKTRFLYPPRSQVRPPRIPRVRAARAPDTGKRPRRSLGSHAAGWPRCASNVLRLSPLASTRSGAICRGHQMR